MTGRLIGAAVTALVVALVLAVVGLQGWFAAAWGLAAGILVAISGAPAHDDLASWPPPLPAERPAGSEVSRLTWAFNPTTGEAGPMVVRRLRRIAEHRLSRLGLDLADPDDHARIDALLGPGASAQLSGLRLSGSATQTLVTNLEQLAAAAGAGRDGVKPDPTAQNGRAR